MNNNNQLFPLFADKTLAVLNHSCGGHVRLDQAPVGRVILTLPGLFTDTSTLDPVSESALSFCTWVIEIPPGRMILLTVEISAHLSLRCAWNEGERSLQNGEAVLLSGCDGDKAILRASGFSQIIVSLVHYGEETFLSYPV